jgi:hypothetical protein
MQTKDCKGKLLIKEASGHNISNKQSMRKMWVQVTKLSRELRDYLTIWAIGNILGVTKDVDMVFTRRFNRARPQVLVLDPALIPISCDVVIGEMTNNPILLDRDDDSEDMGSKEGEGEEGRQYFMQEDSD